MRKVLPAIFACIIGIGGACAAVRDASTISRTGVTQNAATGRAAKQNNIVSRATTQSVKVRNTQQPTTSPRGTTSRNTTTGVSRAAVSRSATPAATARTSGGTIGRSAQSRITRAATTPVTTNSKTFGTGYNTCRDAYFTCMDQFCASQDDTYRRCVCSSRLYEILGKQRALNQSADNLQDFKDLNIEAIPKTAAEVQAMQNASEGEMVSSVIKDKSAAMAQLAGISAVLSKTKSKSLSTAGTLDIAGDINSIWATTDLTSGLNISNLTGETLYNAVHSQCANLVAERCSSNSLLNMVVSAYGMYIENDCSLLSNALDKKKLSANASIRETEREMNVARLENYNAHNSSSINDCIAMVRRDITADTACGENYVHCLDISGLYLNKTTGEPIYSSNFYQLGSTISLSGDILTNQINRIFVAELNRKKIFAEHSLDTCRDLADNVWDEFMRQAITEIYQGQQTRIRNVRNECLDVINQCYDAQSNSLKDFSNVKSQLLLGARLELSEELCREKLAACSNLYGGGPDGLQELVTTMTDIVTQKIAQNCFETLQEYAKQLCAVPSKDTLHSYPYACRAYAPGEQMYAALWECNKNTIASASDDDFSDSNDESTAGISWINKYVLRLDNPIVDGEKQYCTKKYQKCKDNYYMVVATPDGDKIIFPNDDNGTYDPAELGDGGTCKKCPMIRGRFYCPKPDNGDREPTSKCGKYYEGSLYQKLVRYAVQACMRPSEINKLTDNSTLPDTLLQDVNATMDLIKVSMGTSLKAECERTGGYWVAAQWDKDIAKENDIGVFQQFYNETGANKQWGYCADPDDISRYYTGEDSSTNQDPESVPDKEELSGS